MSSGAVRVEHGGHAPAHRRSPRPGRDHRRGLAARSRPPRMAGDRARPRGPGRLPGGRARGVRARRRRRAQRGASRRRRSGQGPRGAGRRPRRRPPPRTSPSRSSSRSTRGCPRSRPGRSRSSRSTSSITSRKVSKDLPPTEIWSFAINGKIHRGTGVSGPMVVTEGDTVDFTLVNGSTKAMKVTMPHSMDFHSAEVNPGKRYADLAPGKSMHYRFVAEAPGRLHVPLRDPAGADAHGHGHGRDVRGQAEEPGSGRQGAVGDPAGVLPRQARPGRRHGQDGRQEARRDRLQRLREPVQGPPDHRQEGRAGPDVRPQRGPEHLERVPRHRHRLRPHGHRGPARRRQPDDEPRAVTGRLGRVHARRGGRLPVRHPRVRRRGQGRHRRPPDRARPEGGRRARHGRLPRAGRGEGATST